ncbi:MAG: hypothetical protein HZC28_18515 [Spirochaetes bacterium]|nr:hypothetical protein [Spirochaetota bacterium]
MAIHKIILSFMILSAAALSQIPAVMHYQGYITSNGTPYTGNADVVFHLYDNPSNGNPLWTSTNAANPVAETVQVITGVYSYLLGSKNPLTNIRWTGNGTYLQIMTRISGGTWGTNASRVQFISVPYAFAAERSLDSNPVGTILPFYGTETYLNSMYNNHYLPCDGATIGRSGSPATRANNAYKDLFIQIYLVDNTNKTPEQAKTAWEAGNIIALPDMRGRFLRGINDGTNRDPDASMRKNESGTIIGDRIGSIQEDAFQGHWHLVRRDYYNDSCIAPGGNGTSGFVNPGATHNFAPAKAKDLLNDTVNGDPRASSETRPKNISVYFIIKY